MNATTRNRISPETAEYNRTQGRGGYTFNAPIESSVTGVGFTVAAVRLGDHAHLDVSSGQITAHDPFTRVNRGDAGHLVLRWYEWEILRDVLAASDRIHIAEVERPTDAQLAFHVPAARVDTRTHKEVEHG